MVWSSTILSCFGYKPPQQYYATLGLNKTHKQSHANWIRLGIKFLSFSIHSSWSLSPVVPPLKVSDTRRKFFSRRKTRPSRSGTRFLCGAVHLGQLCNQATHCHSWPQFLHCLDFLQIFGRFHHGSPLQMATSVWPPKRSIKNGVSPSKAGCRMSN